MQISLVTTSDIPLWESLSSEYDNYVKELVGDREEWYEGSKDSMAFAAYMESKITQKEAFMAVDSGNRCLGIIALSKRHNRITFFGVSHDADFLPVGSALLLHALKKLDASRGICINEITSQAVWIEQHRNLFRSLGFALSGSDLENGVPVDVFTKPPIGV